MHRRYWEAYSGVKAYEASLIAQWNAKGGWFYDGLGYPTPLSIDKKKDILNQGIQKAGHIMLMFVIQELYEMRKEVDWIPICIDYHDASCIAYKEEDEDKILDMFKKAYDNVNKKLGGKIPLGYSYDVGYNIAEAKGLKPEDD